MHANRRPYSKEYFSPKRMVAHRQYASKKHPTSSPIRLLPLTVPTTSNISYDTNDLVWNNPMELDLLDVKKAPLITSMNENYFLKVLPCIRRLYTIFNSICPNVYRIHCSDSMRILQEIICLVEEYLHISLPTNVTPSDLLNNEEYFDEFLHKLRFSSFNYFYSNARTSSKKSEIHCFGQGIRCSDDNNKLNQMTVFCFELTTSIENTSSLPMEILILDPHENIVPNNIKYINTYDKGYKKLYSCSYKPITQAGFYKITIFHNGVQLTPEPFTVFIRNSNQSKDQFLSDDSKVTNAQDIPEYTLEGDGCSTKVILNSIARLRLRIASTTNPHYKSTVDPFSISIVDPFGHTIAVQRRILSFDLLELTYQPMSVGEHHLSISYNNKVHRHLTIDVINDETSCLSILKPFGPGLQRAIVGLPTEFYVDLSQQKLNNPTINHSHLQFCLEPSYHAEIDYEQQMATVRYTPITEGDCPIHIIEYNKDIPNSPFIAHIKREHFLTNKPHVRITGLSEQIIIHRPVEFEVSIDNPFDDPTHSLHVQVLTEENSPSIFIDRQNHSSYKCSFIPVSLGRHIISIDYTGIVPENNPFYCQAIQEKDIQLTGPAINSQCLELNKPTHFFFKLEDFLLKNSSDQNLAYESGYSSNDDTSQNSSPPDGIKQSNNEPNHYQVTITDGHGQKKPNVFIKKDPEYSNDHLRVDFTPDEQILYINISCTW